MNKFTNLCFLKERKKMVRNLFISFILLVIAGIFWGLRCIVITKANENIKSLDSIAIDPSGNNENKKAYMDVSFIPYKFAEYDSTTNAYYLVEYGEYIGVVYMSVSDYNKLNNDDISDNSIRISGITKKTSDDIKEIAIETINEAIEDEEKKLQISDYDNNFGDVYLDMTLSDNEIAIVPFRLFVLFLIFGGFSFLFSLISLFRFIFGIRELTEDGISILDKEMNNKNSLYFENIHLYLTKHYIINFAYTFQVINYNDILWMYSYTRKSRGIKKSKSIKILVNDGSTYTLATIYAFTKNKDEIYNKVWDTILNKNSDIVTGYTKENIKLINDKLDNINNS
jgi:hypothetical protein